MESMHYEYFIVPPSVNVLYVAHTINPQFAWTSNCPPFAYLLGRNSYYDYIKFPFLWSSCGLFQMCISKTLYKKKLNAKKVQSYQDSSFAVFDQCVDEYWQHRLWPDSCQRSNPSVARMRILQEGMLQGNLTPRLLIAPTQEEPVLIAESSFNGWEHFWGKAFGHLEKWTRNSLEGKIGAKQILSCTDLSHLWSGLTTAPGH